MVFLGPQGLEPAHGNGFPCLAKTKQKQKHSAGTAGSRDRNDNEAKEDMKKDNTAAACLVPSVRTSWEAWLGTATCSKSHS